MKLILTLMLLSSAAQADDIAMLAPMTQSAKSCVYDLTFNHTSATFSCAAMVESMKSADSVISDIKSPSEVERVLISDYYEAIARFRKINEVQ